MVNGDAPAAEWIDSDPQLLSRGLVVYKQYPGHMIAAVRLGQAAWLDLEHECSRRENFESAQINLSSIVAIVPNVT